jgi:hypothetical protein
MNGHNTLESDPSERIENLLAKLAVKLEGVEIAL